MKAKLDLGISPRRKKKRRIRGTVDVRASRIDPSSRFGIFAEAGRFVFHGCGMHRGVRHFST